MDNLPQEILNRLDLLASKLGVTVQYIWSILIHQAKIEAYTDLGISLIAIIPISIAITYGRKSYKHHKEDRHYSDEFFWAALSCYFIAFVLSVISIVSVYDSITPLLNPECWALQQVLQIWK